jgi:hypothetical protein
MSTIDYRPKADRKALDEAAARGWLLDCKGCGYETRRAWESCCNEAGRPCGVLCLRRKKMAEVNVTPPKGRLISRAGVEAINSWLRPILGPQDMLGVHRFHIDARLRDHDAARELMPLLCDAVAENESSRDVDDDDWSYGVRGGGKSYHRWQRVNEEAAHAAQRLAQAAWSALAGVALDEVPPVAAGDPGQREQARLTRELFRRLRVPHMRVRMARGAHCFWVYVEYPPLQEKGERIDAREKVQAVLGRAFPGLDPGHWFVQSQ